MQGNPSETMPDRITPSTEAAVSLDVTTLQEESVTFSKEASCSSSSSSSSSSSPQPDMPSTEVGLILEEPDNLVGMLSDHSERPTSSPEGSSCPSEEGSSPVEPEKGGVALEGGGDADSSLDKTECKGPVAESPAVQANESGKSKKKKKKRSKAPRFTKLQVEDGATPDCGVANVASAVTSCAHSTLLTPGGADSLTPKALQVPTEPLAPSLTPAVNGPTETASKKKKKSKAKPRGPLVEKPPEGAGNMPQVIPVQDVAQKGKPQAAEGSKESGKKKSKSKNKGRALDPVNSETSGTPSPSNIAVPTGLLPCPVLIPKAKLVKDPVLDLKDSAGVDVAEFLTDILKNNPRDRMFLLKMEHDILEFIKDSNANIHSLSPMTSYHRLLAHRVATHFGLEHAVHGPKGTTLMLHKTANTRIPLQRFKEHFAVEETSPTPRKLILKRESPPASAPQSHGPAMALDRRSKSLEEREEEYRLARERIFSQSPMQSEPGKPNGNSKGEKSSERSAPAGKAGGLGVRRMHSADAEPGSWHPSRAGVSVLRRAESTGEGGGIATHTASAGVQMNVTETAAHFEGRCTNTLVNCQPQMPRAPAVTQDGGRMVHVRGEPRFSGQTQPSYPTCSPSQQALYSHWALQRSPFLPAGGVPSPSHTELPCGQSPQHGLPGWGRNNNNNQASGPPRNMQMHGGHAGHAGHAGHGNRGHASTGNRALQQQSQSFRDVDGAQGLLEHQYMGHQHTLTSSSSATIPHQHHSQQWRGSQPNPYQAMCSNPAVPLGSMGAQSSHKQFAASVAQPWQSDAQRSHGASPTGQSMSMNLRTPDLREGTNNSPGNQHHYGLTGPARHPAHGKQNPQNVPRGQMQYHHWPPGHMDHYSTQSVQGQYAMHPGHGPPGNYSSQGNRGHFSTQGPLGHVGHYPSQGRVAGPGGHGLQHVMPNGTSLMPPSHHEGASFHTHTPMSGMMGPGGCPIPGEAEGALHQLNISPPSSVERGSRRGGGGPGWEMSMMYSTDKGPSQVPGGSQLQEACAPTHGRPDGPPARPPQAWYPQQYGGAALHSGHGNTGLDHRLAVGVTASDVPNGYPHSIASTLVSGTEQVKTGKRKGRGKKGARQPPLPPHELLQSQSHIPPHMMEMQR